MSFIEEEEHLTLIGEVLQKEFPGKGFALLVFQFNEPDVCNYVSNAKREDMVKALRESANRLENNKYIGITEANA